MTTRPRRQRPLFPQEPLPMANRSFLFRKRRLKRVFVPPSTAATLTGGGSGHFVIFVFPKVAVIFFLQSHDPNYLLQVSHFSYRQLSYVQITSPCFTSIKPPTTNQMRRPHAIPHRHLNKNASSHFYAPANQYPLSYIHLNFSVAAASIGSYTVDLIIMFAI